MNTEEIFHDEIQSKILSIIGNIYRTHNITFDINDGNSEFATAIDKVYEIFDKIRLKEKCLRLALQQYKMEGLIPSIQKNEAIIDLANKIEEQLLPKAK
jgi:predicted membrane protein